MSRSDSEAAKRASSQAGRAASSPAGERTRIKVVLNIGRMELELLRTLKELRSIEPLARFQVLPLDGAVHQFGRVLWGCLSREVLH